MTRRELARVALRPLGREQLENYRANFAAGRVGLHTYDTDTVGSLASGPEMTDNNFRIERTRLLVRQHPDLTLLAIIDKGTIHEVVCDLLEEEYGRDTASVDTQDDRGAGDPTETL